MTMTHFDGCAEAQAHLDTLLDAAEQGRAAIVRHGQACVAFVDVARLLDLLAAASPRVQLEAADGAWAACIPGVPIAVEATTLDETVDEMVDALQEYARVWDDRLRLAPNHADNWTLVHLVALSDDDQLRAWITKVPDEPAGSGED